MLFTESEEYKKNENELLTSFIFINIIKNLDLIYNKHLEEEYCALEEDIYPNFIIFNENSKENQIIQQNLIEIVLDSLSELKFLLNLDIAFSLPSCNISEIFVNELNDEIFSSREFNMILNQKFKYNIKFLNENNDIQLENYNKNKHEKIELNSKKRILPNENLCFPLKKIKNNDGFSDSLYYKIKFYEKTSDEKIKKYEKILEISSNDGKLIENPNLFSEISAKKPQNKNFNKIQESNFKENILAELMKHYKENSSSIEKKEFSPNLNKKNINDEENNENSSKKMDFKTDYLKSTIKPKSINCQKIKGNEEIVENKNINIVPKFHDYLHNFSLEMLIKNNNSNLISLLKNYINIILI